MERIRDIRASEAPVYQKVRDILALSVDYEAKAGAAQTFYDTIQNRMLYAVTNHTAAELIAARCDGSAPNMGLTTWKGARVRKGDVATAKNYLAEPEIKELNLIVTMFLDTAELRASRRKVIYLAEWEGVLNTFLKSNELPLLRGAGSVSAQAAEQLAHQHYAEFDAKRNDAERAAAAKVDELDELKRVADTAKAVKSKRTKKGGGDA
jgi:hypothetical protein